MMRLLRRCGCLLAAGSLLMFSGCSAKYKQKGPERDASVVSINNCQADPDTTRVHRNDTVSWTVPNADTHTYTIQFSRTPIPESTVKVNANAPDKPHPVKGDFWCTSFGSCLYAYTLTKEDGAACPDPGLHVIP